MKRRCEQLLDGVVNQFVRATTLRATVLLVASARHATSPMSKRARVATSAGEGKAWYEYMYSGAMSEEYQAYMANEWGHEKRGDQPLFEKLSLEGAQAGLSWSTILAKREGYRSAFHNFDIRKCARMTGKDVDRLLSEESARIVRHRGKIESVIHNAQRIEALAAQAQADGVPTPPHGHFDALLWRFVGGAPKLNAWPSSSAIPSESAEATAMSKALKALGFKFVGPKCCYSLMQSCGLIIDHPKGTPEWEAARARLVGNKDAKEASAESGTTGSGSSTSEAAAAAKAAKAPGPPRKRGRK